MAHARRKTRELRPQVEITEAVWAFFWDEPEEKYLALEDANPFTLLELEYCDSDGELLKKFWEAARGEVLAGWAKNYPGTRPSAWWRLEAPRQPIGIAPDCYWDGKLPIPRKFVSGAGCPVWRVMNVSVGYHLGLPTGWAGFDANDPPTFESQAAYLKRHELLRPGELSKLTAADYAETETLDADCESAFLGPHDGPNAEGVPWLNAMDERVRARIVEVRKETDSDNPCLASE